MELIIKFIQKKNGVGWCNKFIQEDGEYEFSLQTINIEHFLELLQFKEIKQNNLVIQIKLYEISCEQITLMGEDLEMVSNN